MVSRLEQCNEQHHRKLLLQTIISFPVRPNFHLSFTNWCRVFVHQTEAHLDTLISEQASFILARSGVGNLYTVYQENRSQRVRLNFNFCL